MLWPNGKKTAPHISSSFGPRKSPTPGASSSHRGTDFTGFPIIRAVAAGTVVAVGTPAGWSGGGTQVWVQHDGFLTRSLHMVKSSPVVKVGQAVAAGDPLGTMGMTGTATGVHLHLEVVVNNTQIDPVPFIADRLATTAGGANASEEDDMFTDQDRANLTSVMLALGASDLNATNEPSIRTAVKILQAIDGQVNGLPDALKAIMSQVNGAPEVLARILDKAPITDAQVKIIADAVAKQTGASASTLDYAAIAKAVNDDAARRMTS